MKKKKSKSISALAVLMSLAMVACSACSNKATNDQASAANSEVTSTSADTTTGSSANAETTEASSASTDTTVATDANTEATTYKYVMMNIPYADFYAAEISGNKVEVDGVSSATLNKTRTGGMMSGGSYHQNSDGSDISGVIFPVAVASDCDLSAFTQITDQSSVSIEVTNRGTTTSTDYTGMEALFESLSYSYYELNEAPDYYKTLTVENGKFSFGKVTGMNTTTLNDISGTVLTSTSYGDFQINLADTGIDALEPTIYGVVIHTQEGADFGLRHLENIWRYTQLAWCTGFTTSVHNCPTSSDHYVDIMGKTITGFTYYTNNGCFEITLKESAYVPYKFANTLSVSDSNITSGSVAIESTGFPADYSKAYTVMNNSGNVMEAFSFDGDTVTWNDTVMPGSYTLSVIDKNNVYSDFKTQFTVFTDSTVAVFDTTSLQLVAADNASAENFANYLRNITAVTIDETKYAASGRGAVEIINPENGTIDLTVDAFATAPVDAAGYSIVVTSTGYPDYSFNLIKSAEN